MSQANNRVIQVGGLDEYHSLSLKKVEADKGGDWGHCKTGLFCEMQTGSLARRGTTRSPSLPSETLRHYGNRVFEFPVHNKPRNAPFVQAPHKCDDDCNGGYSTKTGMSRPAGCCASWASVERPRLAPSEIKWADELEKQTRGGICRSATLETNILTARSGIGRHRLIFSGRFPRRLRLSLRAKRSTTQRDSTLPRSRSADLKPRPPLHQSPVNHEATNEFKLKVGVSRLRDLFEQQTTSPSPTRANAPAYTTVVKMPTRSKPSNWVMSGGGQEECDYETPEKILHRLTGERKQVGVDGSATTQRPTVLPISSKSIAGTQLQAFSGEVEILERRRKLVTADKKALTRAEVPQIAQQLKTMASSCSMKIEGELFLDGQARALIRHKDGQLFKLGVEHVTEMQNQEQAITAAFNREDNINMALSDVEGAQKRAMGCDFQGARSEHDGRLLSALSDVEEAGRDLTKFWFDRARPRLPLPELIAHQQSTQAHKTSSQTTRFTSSHPPRELRNENLVGETLATFLRKQITENAIVFQGDKNAVTSDTSENSSVEFQTTRPVQADCETQKANDAKQKTPCEPSQPYSSLRRRAPRRTNPANNSHDNRFAVFLQDDVIYRKDYGSANDLNVRVRSPVVNEVCPVDAKGPEKSIISHSADSFPANNKRNSKGESSDSDESSTDVVVRRLRPEDSECWYPIPKAGSPSTRGELSQADLQDNGYPNSPLQHEKEEGEKGLRSIRLSLIAAPKDQIPVVCRDAAYIQQLKNRAETPPGSCGSPPSDSGIWGRIPAGGATATAESSRSSQDSTVFSYPWDLPPPLAAQVASGETTPNPNSPTISNSNQSNERARWVTLHRHVTGNGDIPLAAVATSVSRGTPVITTTTTTAPALCSKSSLSLTSGEESLADGLVMSRGMEESPVSLTPIGTNVECSNEIQAPLYTSVSSESESSSNGSVSSVDRWERFCLFIPAKRTAEEEPYGLTVGQTLQEAEVFSKGSADEIVKKRDSPAYHQYAVLKPSPNVSPYEIIIHENATMPDRPYGADFVEHEPMKLPHEEMTAGVRGVLLEKMKLWQQNRGSSQKQQQDKTRQDINTDVASGQDFFDEIELARPDTGALMDSIMNPQTRRLNHVWLLPDIPFPSGLQGTEMTATTKSFSLAPTPKERGVNAPGHHIRDFVYVLANDGECAFSKQVLTFIDCTKQRGYCNPQITMQCVRQFMSGLINYLQNNPANGIDVALAAEQEELRGFTYVNVSRQLEKVIQELILRPLHHHLNQEIMEALIKGNTARSAAHFSKCVFKEYDRLCSSENQALVKSYLLDPLIRIFEDIQHTFRPDKKIGGLVKILKTIDEFVQRPHATASSKQTMYAVVLALSSLLVTSTTTDFLSPIDVQRLYVEGLMARQYLQSSADGCGCLTDLSCVLRCTEPMLPSALCTAEAVLALKNSAIAREHSTFGNNQRRRGQSLRPELIRPTWSPPSSKMVKPLTEKFSSQCLGSVESRTGTANKDLSEDLETLVLVLAVDEEVSKFKLLDFPVRHSLTVRELCNLLARRMDIFDPKEFGLFIHLENDDLPLDDSLRLEQVLQRYARQRTSSNSMDRSYGVTHPISSLPTSSTVSTKKLGRCIPPLSPLMCHKVPNPPFLASFGTGDIDVTCRDGDSAEDLSPLEQKTRNPVDTAARFSFMLFVYRRCSDLLVLSKELSSYCLASIGGGRGG